MATVNEMLAQKLGRGAVAAREGGGVSVNDMIKRKREGKKGKYNIPPQLPNPSLMDKVGAYTGSFANAALGNQLPRVLAGVDALTNGRSYDENFAARRAMMDRQNEIAGVLPQVAGAVTTGVMAPQVGAAGLLAKVAPKAAPKIMNSLSGSTAVNAADAVAFGALTRSGDGEGTSGGQAAMDAGIGGAANLLLRGAGRVISPVRNQSSAAEREMMDVLDREGIPITAGDRTRNRAVQWAEQYAEDIRDSGIKDRQQQAMNRAVTRRVGETSDNLTTDYFEAQQRRIGRELDYVDDNVRLQVNPYQRPVWVTELNTIQQNYLTARQGNPAQKKVINQIERLKRINQLNGPQLRELQANMREIGEKYSREKGQSSAAARAFRQMNELLENQIARGYGPDEPLLFRRSQAKQDYKNLQIAQDAAARAPIGKKGEGFITPNNLEAAVRGALSRNQYSRGASDLSEIARAAGGIISEFPNSGTAQRQSIERTLRVLGAIGTSGMMGGAAGAAVGGFVPMMAGAALGSIVGKPLLSRAITNKYTQRWLQNQRMNSPQARADMSRYASAGTRGLLAAQNQGPASSGGTPFGQEPDSMAKRVIDERMMRMFGGGS